MLKYNDGVDNMLIIYGGSFNPVTKAHEEIVDILKKEFKDSKILLMPVNKDNYNWKNNLASNIDRYNMLNLVFESSMISTYEFDNINYGGTYKLIEHFKQDHSDVYFVIGTDNLIQMSQWLNYDKLLDCNFILFERHTDEIPYDLVKKYRGDFKIIKYDNEISSTKVRLDINKYKKFVDERVYDYIIKHKLYEVSNV